MVRRKMDKTTNKVQHTTVGDEINYFVNGVNKIGIVVKMSGSYITMFNNDKYDTVHIDETFFVKDIIGKNKSWNDMSFEERSEELYKIKAYSPRFLGKSWEQLPPELREVMKIKDGALPKKGELPQTFQSQSMISANRGVGNEKQLKEYDNYDNKHGLTSRTDKDRTNPLTSSSRHQINVPAASQFETPEEIVEGKKTPKGSKSPKDIASKVKAFEALYKQKFENYFGKSWEQLPPELKEVLLKSNLENGSYGSIGGSPNVGISTNINFDADKDYEGHSHDDKSKEFKHDEIKPSIKKDGIGNGMVSSTDSGMYNTKYGENGRVNDQEKDKKC